MSKTNLTPNYFLGLSPRHCGTLPFSFITWFVYSSVLVAKLCLILSSGIPTELVQADMKNNTSASMHDMHDPIHGLDSNLLKVAVGLSALVFIIMLQAHHNHDPDSPHSGYITGVCHNIAVEVFDSVSTGYFFIRPTYFLTNLTHNMMKYFVRFTKIYTKTLKKLF